MRARRRRRGRIIARIAAGAALLVVAAVLARAEPIDPAAVRVLDGDTIEARGAVFRLVGFDTPETGGRARCAPERALGAKATARLVAIVAGGALDLAPVVCACRSGTEGTPRCNYGRRCGTLTANGRDVGAILIGEQLARPYVCGPRSCPARLAWCLQ